MLDPIIAFFQRIFSAIGRGNRHGHRLDPVPLPERQPLVRLPRADHQAVVGLFLVILVGSYLHFVWITQVWTGFNPDYVTAYKLDQRKFAAGAGCQRRRRRGPDRMPDIRHRRHRRRSHRSGGQPEYLDFLDAALQARPVRDRLDHTPWLDNKASFQRGVNQTVRRTTGGAGGFAARVRGTSGINNTLQAAPLQTCSMTRPPGISASRPSASARRRPTSIARRVTQLKQFNTELGKCQSVFDGRADNLLEFLDRIANDLGSTSAMLRERSENYNAGWFDTRADDRFWFAYGQLYGYYGILTAARAISAPSSAAQSRPLWNEMLKQFRAALNINRRSSPMAAKTAGSCRPISPPRASTSPGAVQPHRSPRRARPLTGGAMSPFHGRIRRRSRRSRDCRKIRRSTRRVRPAPPPSLCNCRSGAASCSRGPGYSDG